MSRKNCPSCNKSQPSDARFCPDCGAPMSKKKVAVASAAKPSKSSMRDTLIIVAAIVVVGGGFLLYKSSQAPPPPPVAQDPPHQGMEGMEALADMPTDYGSLIAVGNQTMDQGNFAVAAESYRRALAINGESPDLRTDYGACLHGMGLPHRAIEEFHTVIAEHPEHRIANYNLGIVYFSQNVADSARFYFEKYLTVDPNGGAAAQAKSYLEKLGG